MPDKKQLTLTSEEMRDFHYERPFDVGRSYGGQVAHIYPADGEARFDSLCQRAHRRSYKVKNEATMSRLYPFYRLDRTCPTCIRRYRQLRKGALNGGAA